MDTCEQMSVEVSGQIKKRQKRSVEEKRRIVEETLAAGASVARVARLKPTQSGWRSARQTYSNLKTIGA